MPISILGNRNAYDARPAHASLVGLRAEASREAAGWAISWCAEHLGDCANGPLGDIASNW